jgi:penicillin-binding protein 1A
MKCFSPEQMIVMMRSFGVTSPLEPVASLCLGSCEINLQEMVSAYTTFTNKGMRLQPMLVTRIEDKNGRELATFMPTSVEVVNEETTYKMLDMLRAVMDAGTGKRARHRYGFKAQAGGKTGTSQNNSDGWFIGFTPSLVSGCWVGGEDRSIHFDRTAIGQGANTSLPIWANYMKKVFADKELGYEPSEKFDIPDWFDPNKNCIEENLDD